MSADRSLSPEEAQALAAHEEIIARGLKTFVEVGNALLAVRNGHLYRATHRTFGDYLRDRWGISRAQGYRLIDAAREAEWVRSVSPNGDIPNSEAQARELARIPANDPTAPSLNVRAAVVQRVERAGGWAEVTAADVRRFVAEEIARSHARRRGSHSRAVLHELKKLAGEVKEGDWSPADFTAAEAAAAVVCFDELIGWLTDLRAGLTAPPLVEAAA